MSIDPIDLIQGARTRHARPFKWMGVEMYGNPNPAPPESIAADVLTLRRMVIRFEKARYKLLSDYLREKINETGDKVNLLAIELEEVMVQVNDAWRLQEKGWIYGEDDIQLESGDVADSEDDEA